MCVCVCCVPVVKLHEVEAVVNRSSMYALACEVCMCVGVECVHLH